MLAVRVISWGWDGRAKLNGGATLLVVRVNSWWEVGELVATVWN